MLLECDRGRLLWAVVSCGLIFSLVGAVTALELRRHAASKDLARESPQDGRVRPPAAITCDRNNLTSYTGKAISYSRQSDRIKLSIQTDWDTTETVWLRFPRNTGPWKWFLLRGETFGRHDWKKFELSRGKLYPDMRVSAWVCTDGRKPILDWQPSTGNETPPPSTP